LTCTFPAIDCDVHPAAPTMQPLLPFLEEYWRNSVVERGIPSLETNSYPARAPISASPQWRGQNGAPEATLGQLTGRVFGRGRAQRAICNCLYGVELLFSGDMAAAFARALNDRIAKEWLKRDARLRASIVVPTQNIELAVEEIERCAPDRRFVQILILAMQESALGRRHWWPIYAAAERHDLPHRGGSLFEGIQTGLVESTDPGRYCYSRPGEMVKCPWDGWEFNIRTGKSWCDPSRLRVRQYPVSVRPGTQLAEGPYAAESFPVRLEDNNVVVEA
jgi:nitrite reductase/ring-hydroxylating ferredoxin subunit